MLIAAHRSRAERLAPPMIIRTRAHRSASKSPPPTRTTPSRTGWTGPTSRRFTRALTPRRPRDLGSSGRSRPGPHRRGRGPNPGNCRRPSLGLRRGVRGDRRTTRKARRMATSACGQCKPHLVVPWPLFRRRQPRSLAASELAAALDDHLYSLNAAIHTDSGEARYPKPPKTYLEDWAAPDAGYLRRFYPAGDDEVHYEITPAFEKAYAWVESLEDPPIRRHRVPTAYGRRAVAADRARHRHRPAAPSDRTTSPTRRARRGDRSRRERRTATARTCERARSLPAVHHHRPRVALRLP